MEGPFPPMSTVALEEARRDKMKFLPSEDAASAWGEGGAGEGGFGGGEGGAAPISAGGDGAFLGL